jgi:hypothetical protein
VNAHGHRKNHPWGIESTADFFSAVDQQQHDGIYSCYPIQSLYQIIAKKLNLNIHKFAEKEVYSQILDYEISEVTELANLCFDRSSHVVYLEADSLNSPLLNYFDRQLEIKFTNLAKPATEQELFEEKDCLWNSNSAKLWQNLGLTNHWDWRERVALDIRPMGKRGIDCVPTPFVNVDLSRKHYRIGVRDLWCRGDRTIVNLMQHLGLTIDDTRWEQWQLIYKQWASKQLDILDFIDNLPYILEAIVNNWYYCLPELTFRQEVLIQHFLIYQYNLNIKTWQLTKFPSNTQNLHALLEANPHPTTLLY